MASKEHDKLVGYALLGIVSGRVSGKDIHSSNTPKSAKEPPLKKGEKSKYPRHTTTPTSFRVFDTHHNKFVTKIILGKKKVRELRDSLNKRHYEQSVIELNRGRFPAPNLRFCVKRVAAA